MAYFSSRHCRKGRRTRVVALALFFLYFCGCLVSLSCAARLSASMQKLESPDGDIIDCVHISKQPAFDHPFLKDHKIQMRPSFHPEGLYDVNKESMGPKERTGSIAQLWHMNGRCPEDTIPHAIAYVEGERYYGAKATINVWGPQVQQPNEFSLSQLWILAGSFGEDLNSIEAGWQVSPDLYGDNNTRLFTYWTTNSEIAMGASISPVSDYQNSQYDINILIWKDPKGGNWWMQFGNDYVLGYWPSFLFSYLGDSASMIEWGGEVVNTEADGKHTSTQMGSGHFPEEGFGKAGYFRNIQVVDSSNNLKSPKGLGTYTEQSNCYDVQTGSNGDWGHYFYFGGPGRNPNCP
nr:uncharacterized protein LOC109148845 [Ipomoea trifida]